MLEAKDLYKYYEKESALVEVIRGVSFQLQPGSQTVLWGASGAGKSTLLHLLVGLDRPTKGDVLINHQSLFQKKDEELARWRNEQVGFVFQFHHLLPLFTALENVAMPALIRGFSQKESTQRASEWLEKVGLTHRMKHRPAELSGGEQQRVAIARALVMKPQWVMADEPTGNLDAKTSSEIFDLFLELNEGLKTSLLVVTHNEELANRFKNRIHICDGKILS
ncbi:MAG: ABC transporter ATP-binding protein [Deltaproteobacteria bacterium]|nr:ABC transporter ATP-binding protein [Deltaproteobacteria bacterium]